MKIELIIYNCFETENPEMFKKDFNQLTDDEHRQF